MAGARILYVDDDNIVLRVVERVLRRQGFEVVCVSSVEDARRALKDLETFPLILCDINMEPTPGTVLLEECAKLAPDTVMVMVTGVNDVQVAVRALRDGAYDYIIKPFDPEALVFAVNRALGRRDGELQLREYRRNLERVVEERTTQLHQRANQLLATQRALVHAICQLAEFRDSETGRHLERMAHYGRIIGHRLHEAGPYRDVVNERFLEQIFDAAPLHDVGKIAIPDVVLRKPSRLNAEEWEVMKRHPMLGRQALQAIRRTLPQEMDGQMIDMAADVAGAHHERFDGGGYPLKLKGPEIPLSARIVTAADYYDACTSVRVYREDPITHDATVAAMREERGGLFDPVVLDAFLDAAPRVNATRQKLAD